MNTEACVMTEAYPITEHESVPTKPRLARPTGLPDLSPLMILITVGLLCGTILHRSHLIYSPNDSSRWNTIYYLVQHGTYEYLPVTVKDVPWAIQDEKPSKITKPLLWTIDMIMVDGKLYSSKPPLLPTVLAGLTWVTQKVTGQTFHENPWFIERTILIVAQVIPFAVMLVLLRRHLFRASESPFVRQFAMGVACFGTLLTPWVVTLNNHVIAAATGMIALDAAIRIWFEGRREWYWFTMAGFFAAFTACIELPAGVLAVILFAALLVKDYKHTLIAGLIPALLPTAVALYTNHVVTGQLMPAYESIDEPGGFYDYPDSYWKKRTGVDALEEPKPVYLAHMLIGHDGFFSLSPILLVPLAGMIVELRRRGDRAALAGMVLAMPAIIVAVDLSPKVLTPPILLAALAAMAMELRRNGNRAGLAAMVLTMTAILVGVYGRTTNNYGGGCHGFRWLFWVIPMWLLFLPAGIEWIRRTVAGRYALYGLLAISVFSVGFALDNPWSTNWIRLIMRSVGIINY
jgi:hypothetical protein